MKFTSVIKGTVSTFIIPNSSFGSKKSPSVFQSAYTFAPANSLISEKYFPLKVSLISLFAYFNNNQNYYNGIDMLIHQAIKSIEIWIEKDISQIVDYQIIKDRLKKDA